jgi:hypothetical protein
VAPPMPRWPCMKTTPALVALLLAMTSAPALAATTAQPPLPKGSKLVGETSVTEIRAFPEEVRTPGGAHTVEEAQGDAGRDRLYETDDKYAAAVSFFDKTLREDRFAVRNRTVTRTSTTWSLRRPDGSVARLAVRNTRPTTIEWVTARAAAETGRPR